MSGDAPAPFAAVVLAGERPGGNALARHLDLPAAVLAPVGGKPCLERVLDSLGGAAWVGPIAVCGPDARAVAASPALGRLLERAGVCWMAPAEGPAASALAAAGALADDPAGGYPLLVTSGDHGLLESTVVDDFCRRAAALDDRADVVVGLVPHETVARAFPASRRTVLGFADGAFCGSNLFALLGPDGRRALQFWRGVEADRKRPWKIARRLGVTTLLRYLLGRLPVDDAFREISRRAGCRVTWTAVDSARAAVDVDSTADWTLADRLLRADQHGRCAP